MAYLFRLPLVLSLVMGVQRQTRCILVKSWVFINSELFFAPFNICWYSVVDYFIFSTFDCHSIYDHTMRRRAGIEPRPFKYILSTQGAYLTLHTKPRLTCPLSGCMLVVMHNASWYMQLVVQGSLSIITDNMRSSMYFFNGPH